MSIQKYIRKRDFKQTTEPTGGKGKGTRLAFVVQRHHASHLHYDFRLEMDGVLKSWAVPKGPSLNPADKRLAMMVEDHPYDYKSFEGTIPKGNYGAGVVSIFDEGTYESPDGKNGSLGKGLKDGNLKIVLHGKKLKGEFALVRIKDNEQNAWLLIKHRDRYAVSKAYDAEDDVPAKIVKAGKDFRKEKSTGKQNTGTYKRSYSPMLAKLVKDVVDEDGWLFEEKLDGYRGIAQLDKEDVILTSRNGKDLTADYPLIVKALQKLNINAVLDGEIVVRLKNKTNFQALQNYLPAQKKADLRYAIFDVLEINGTDITTIPLSQRKKLLEKLLEGNSQKAVELIKPVKTDGKSFLKEAEKKGWEGIIAKEESGFYYPGKRTSQWQKIKILQSQEAIIIGFTRPAGERSSFGALVLAIKGKDGKLTYIGNCGTGFTNSLLKAIRTTLAPLETPDKPLAEKVAQENNVTWVLPKLVCEVTFSEWTENHHLRHPVFKTLRTDKKVAEVKEEQADLNDIDELQLRFGKKTVKLTNQNKLYWQKEKITKGEVVQYYREMAQYILPHLKNRPLSLNRHPNGVDKPGFFQKDLNIEQIPSWIKYASLRSEHLFKEIDYLICNDEATLLWMANLGCIEINPWMSTFNKPEIPLFAVLDLDPHGQPFEKVIEVALTAKAVLDELNIVSFVKTSGSKGLHIVVPLSPYDFEISKNFIHYVAGLVYEQHPRITSLERKPDKRKNKIYLDYLQNRKGQTIVAPYSLRPRSGATVSAPLHWDEVNMDLRIEDFNIFNMTERIHKTGDIWKGIYKVQNKIGR